MTILSQGNLGELCQLEVSRRREGARAKVYPPDADFGRDAPRVLVNMVCDARQ